jgi:hypothetical protein
LDIHSFFLVFSERKTEVLIDFVTIPIVWFPFSLTSPPHPIPSHHHNEGHQDYAIRQGQSHLALSVSQRRDPLLTFSQGPDELVVESLPDVQAAPDQYLIAVHAAAANFFDILQIQGKYQNQPRRSSSSRVY